MIDKENENRYQRTAGFFQVDGEAWLEEANLVMIPEVAKVDPFTGLMKK
jgi:hypothetical protein